MHWIRAFIALAILASVSFFAFMVARGMGGIGSVMIVQFGSLCGILWFVLDIFLILLRGNPFKARFGWVGLAVDVAGVAALCAMMAWVGRALMGAMGAVG